MTNYARQAEEFAENGLVTVHANSRDPEEKRFFIPLPNAYGLTRTPMPP